MFSYFLITALLFSANASQARSCYTLDPNSVKVEWTAYKFTEKTPVKGYLKTAKATVSAPGKTLEDMLQKTSFEVDALSVDTENPVRDATLRDNFFSLMANTKITGRILSINNNNVNVEMVMNNVKKTVKFKLRKGDPVVSAVATIDILDFAMTKSFNKIQEACEILHKGADNKAKTWSTVDLHISATLSDCQPKG